MINYVALLGASYEEGRELFTLSELASRFSLEKLNKAAAIFDYKKLEWYNAQYIRMKTDDELAALSLPCAITGGLFGAPNAAPTSEQKKLFTDSMPLVKERAIFLQDIQEKLCYLFSEPVVPPKEEFIPKKSDIGTTIKLLNFASELIPQLALSQDSDAELLVKAKAEKENVKLGDLLMPLRLAITGSRVSPPLFGSVRLLGATKSLERVARALNSLKSP